MAAEPPFFVTTLFRFFSFGSRLLSGDADGPRGGSSAADRGGGGSMGSELIGGAGSVCCFDCFCFVETRAMESQLRKNS